MQAAFTRHAGAVGALCFPLAMRRFPFPRLVALFGVGAPTLKRGANAAYNPCGATLKLSWSACEGVDALLGASCCYCGWMLLCLLA